VFVLNNKGVRQRIHTNPYVVSDKFQEVFRRPLLADLNKYEDEESSSCGPTRLSLGGLRNHTSASRHIEYVLENCLLNISNITPVDSLA